MDRVYGKNLKETVINMKANIKKIKKMDLAFLNGLQAIFIKGNMKMI